MANDIFQANHAGDFGIKVNGYTADQLGSGQASALTDPAQLNMLSNSDFTAGLASQGIDINSLTSNQLGDLYKGFKINPAVSTNKINPAVSTNKLDWGMNGLGGTLLGAGQLGLGLMSYLDQSKTASKQRAIMDQQIASNKYNMAKTKADNQHIQDVFNPSYQPKYM